jgi:hypothetical protein
MLNELCQIHDETVEEGNNNNNTKTISSVDSDTIESNKNNFNIHEEFKSTHFDVDTVKCEDINFASIEHTNDHLDIESENTELEIMRKQLEEEIGLDLLINVYKIIISTTPEGNLKCDEEEIGNEIRNKLMNTQFSPQQIDNAIQKIKEIWILVLKERNENLVNKK